MKRNNFYLITLLFISLFIIFFQFNLIPKNLSFDEIDFAKLALSLNNKIYIPYSSLATGHSTLYFYILLFSFKLFGFTNFALRLPSAIFGFLSIIVFYFLIKELLPKNKFLNLFAFISTFILATSRWFFNFARFSFEATFLLILELFSLFFIVKFLKNKKNYFLLLSGVFAGLSFLSYIPGRIFVFIPLLVLFLNKITWKKYIIFLTSFIIVALPLMYYLLTNADLRIKQASIFSQNTSLASKITLITENAKKTTLMFFLKGDMNGRHNYPGKPAINSILGLLFISGLFLSLKRINLINNKIMFSYFLIAIIPTLFTRTIDNPNMLRTYTSLPSIVFFITTALIYLLNIKTKRIYVLTFIFFLVIFSSLYELRTYFFFQSRVVKNSFEVKCNLEDINKFGTNIIPKSCRVQKNEF